MSSQRINYDQTFLCYAAINEDGAVLKTYETVDQALEDKESPEDTVEIVSILATVADADTICFRDAKGSTA